MEKTKIDRSKLSCVTKVQWLCDQLYLKQTILKHLRKMSKLPGNVILKLSISIVGLSWFVRTPHGSGSSCALSPSVHCQFHSVHAIPNIKQCIVDNGIKVKLFGWSDTILEFLSLLLNLSNRHSLFTLYGTGNGSWTGNGNRKIDVQPNGSWSRSLSLSQCSWYSTHHNIETHCFPVPFPFPVPCSVNKP